jgi:uncharacterized cupredoxin-like copper-binding protein
MKRLRLYAGGVIVSVALLAGGCGGDDDKSSDTSAATTDTTDTTAADKTASARKATTLKAGADAGGRLKFDKSSLSAPAGKVTIVMDNPSDLPHAVAIEGNGVDVEGETVDKGGVSTAAADLKAGRYAFYCPVGGHRDAGMEGALTVK